MNNKKLSFFFVFLISCFYNYFGDKIEISAKSAILICADTCSIVYSKNENMCLPIASVTKVMTAILLLEKIQNFGDSEIEITDEMVRVEGSSMGLQVGDVLKQSDLVVGMLLPSGNDAANTSSIAVSGDTENFVKLMNEKAKQLGMKNTKFTTPSGLDKNNNHSSALDVATLAAYCLENKEFKNIVSQKSKRVSVISPSKTIFCKNHNKLLKLYKYCTGIKTGFTKLAGRCLLSSAKNDEGKELIAVTLNASDDWNDHISLFEYGFKNTAIKNFNDKDFSVKIKVKNSDIEEIELGSLSEFSRLLKLGDEKNLQRKIEIPEFCEATIEEGQILGKISYYLNGELIGYNNLSANQKAGLKKSTFRSLWESIKKFFHNSYLFITRQ
ncbi:MAG: D-alanyl-D-alanine carboxypeptidase [Candidatus Paraimprobicoccus trichonymphae]|uniref:serine-type D-Ala-D-Ala carboxypeptidase n=1 Tax=Candidatus Paraimprobicoccus trichonymphae TaxID=3033793 RepID=A0AA48KWI9_9FIRM|nr:MAG: D-alanyl-D-alanine carboxypeptidase [Candidatus Paraimprobicoccus trichonymphae]